MVETLRFRGCTVVIDREIALVRTTFEGGAMVEALPMLDPESIERAGQLGYEGSDVERVRRMTLEHDVLHTVLAEAEGHPWSWTLHAVAHGYRLAAGVVEREERLVLCAARLLNRGLADLLASITVLSSVVEGCQADGKAER